MKKNWQIRTNRRQFGDSFGVYIDGKFVKQTSYSHGTFSATREEARALTKMLSDNARGSWVRLYEMIG